MKIRKLYVPQINKVRNLSSAIIKIKITVTRKNFIPVKLKSE